MIIGFLKIAFLLGFLIFIHELGHFLVAKLFNVKIKQFAIGFGPTIWKKQGKETSYEIKAIPMGGFVNMLGEDEPVEDQRAYNQKTIPQKIAILLAGGTVNIIFGLILCAIIASSILGFQKGLKFTGNFLGASLQGIIELFTGKVKADQLVGVVGISDMVVETNGLKEFIYMMSVISVSLGITNLLPFPPLDRRKNISTPNRSNPQKTTKTNHRTKNPNGRISAFNWTFNICDI